MNRVIERHVADPEGLARTQGGVEAALDAEWYLRDNPLAAEHAARAAGLPA